MFIRSVVLSLEYFKRSQVRRTILGSNLHGCSLKDISMREDNCCFGFMEDKKYCKIPTIVSYNIIRLLKNLMCAVRVDVIKQVLYHNLAPLFNSLSECTG